jgi:hypothetical protein
MRKWKTGLIGMGLAVGLALGLGAAPAQALPGASLDASVKFAHRYKTQLMGVTYFVSGKKVIGESWSSEMAGWDHKAADKLRAAIAGKRKLKKTERKVGQINHYYADGTLIQYNERKGTVITIDVTAPGFTKAAYDAGKYLEVADWKARPYKGKAW